MIRFAFDRSPDYFAALRVEGHHSEVLVCRDARTGQLLATGHRSIKPMFVNGESTQTGYLGGLRVAETARGGRVLARGYGFLRQLHARQPVGFYLTTIMEDNERARSLLASGRCGLPRYHDFGRFCCIALSLRERRHPCRLAAPSMAATHDRRALRLRNTPAGMPARPDGTQLCVRHATAADAPAVVAFLQREGRLRQFFPDYQVSDFGGGLLPHLDWGHLLLASRGGDLLGIVAAWDQRGFRQWRVTGYAPWLRLLRRPFNLVSSLRHLPALPKPGAALDYFVLSLVCVRDNNRAVFGALLDELARSSRYEFCLAGLHERDPLLPELLARPHVPLPSRLYVVAWEDGAEAVQQLDRTRVPYLELGSL